MVWSLGFRVHGPLGKAACSRFFVYCVSSVVLAQLLEAEMEMDAWLLFRGFGLRVSGLYLEIQNLPFQGFYPLIKGS